MNNIGLAILVQDKMHITQLFQEGKTIITCSEKMFRPVDFALFIGMPQAFCQWLYFEEHRIYMMRYAIYKGQELKKIVDNIMKTTT